MKIGFIGAGKVGFTLGKYFTVHGIKISGYYSRNNASAQAAAIFTQSTAYSSLAEIVANSDALFLTCPDGEIENLWHLLKQYPLKGKSICHCSGALSSAIFSDIEQIEAFGYSIHPLFAIHSKTDSFKSISTAFFTLEGHSHHLNDWKNLLESLGNPVHIIPTKNKVLYHSAAVFASNLVCALFGQATTLLEQCGFDEESAREAISPLFLNNALSLSQQGTVKALTGPLERADVSTIQKHLQVLSGQERDTYKILSLGLIHIAKEKNPQRDYSTIVKTLSS